MLDPCLLLSCWQVQYEEGEALAKELGIDYVETSAMNGVGIDTDKGPTAFTRLINCMDALAADGDDEDASCLEAALDICLCSSHAAPFSFTDVPRLVETLAVKQVVGASAGEMHAAVWTEAGELTLA